MDCSHTGPHPFFGVFRLEQGAIMIRKTKSGYKVLSSKGKNLGGPYKSLAEAKKRLRQVEFFKGRKG